MSEADTRHQIIDVILHDVLSIPRSSTKCEDTVDGQYTDYTIHNQSGKAVWIIEAKRSGISFEVPKNVIAPHQKNIKKVKLRQLCINKEIHAAVNQVLLYAVKKGAKIAAITNGNVFIVFKTMVDGVDLLDTESVVIPSLDYINRKIAEFTSLFSYDSICKTSFGSDVFQRSQIPSHSLYAPKDKLRFFDDHVDENEFARFLGPIAKKFFSDIPANDFQFMRKCYVNARQTQQTQNDIVSSISSCMTPYLESSGVKNIDEIRSGGRFAERLANIVQAQREGEVLVLFGSKGSGKSTFLRKLFLVDKNEKLKMYCLPVIIDFIKPPRTPEQINEFAYAKAIELADENRLLSGDISDLAKLFKSKYDLAMRQEFYGMDHNSSEFAKLRNKFLTDLKNDKLETLRALKSYWQKEERYIVVIADNTDQLEPELQDHCFLLSQQIARELGCTVIISMREERYCRARIVGVLDAYPNNGFHISSPDFQGVFEKRIDYACECLAKHSPSEIGLPLDEDVPFDELKKFFEICRLQFKNPDNALSVFIRHCSYDNMRIALDFFQRFAQSGYTHVDEIIDNYPHWTVSEHQVVKPMMIPDRHHYSELKSEIPNLFAQRTADGSHFTLIRILNYLSQFAPNFISVSDVVSHFDGKFNMSSDCEVCIDKALLCKLVESNNRLDRLKIVKMNSQDDFVSADSIKLTSFGRYMLDHLCGSFTYLDLVSADMGYDSEYWQNELVQFLNKEHEVRRDKLTRINVRLAKVEKFFEYLVNKEQEEVVKYNLDSKEQVVPRFKTQFLSEKPRVLESATRSAGKQRRERGG